MSFDDLSSWPILVAKGEKIEAGNPASNKEGKNGERADEGERPAPLGQAV